MMAPPRVGAGGLLTSARSGGSLLRLPALRAAGPVRRASAASPRGRSALSGTPRAHSGHSRGSCGSRALARWRSELARGGGRLGPSRSHYTAAAAEVGRHRGVRAADSPDGSHLRLRARPAPRRGRPPKPRRPRGRQAAGPAGDAEAAPSAPSGRARCRPAAAGERWGGCGTGPALGRKGGSGTKVNHGFLLIEEITVVSMKYIAGIE